MGWSKNEELGIRNEELGVWNYDVSALPRWMLKGGCWKLLRTYYLLLALRHIVLRNSNFVLIKDKSEAAARFAFDLSYPLTFGRA